MCSFRRSARFARDPANGLTTCDGSDDVQENGLRNERETVHKLEKALKDAQADQVEAERKAKSSDVLAKNASLRSRNEALSEELKTLSVQKVELEDKLARYTVSSPSQLILKSLRVSV